MVVAITWFYEVNKEFLPYPEHLSEEVERQFNAWQENSFNCQGGRVEVTSGKYPYTVDFNQMSQINSLTGKCRRVKRVASDRDRELLALRAQVHDAERRLQQQIASHRTTQDALAKLQQDHHELRSEHNALQVNYSAIESANEELQREKAMLQSELTSLRLELETVQTQHLELKQAHSELSATHALLQAQHEELRTQHEELQCEHAEVRREQEETTSSLQLVWQYKTIDETWQMFDVELGEQLAALYKVWRAQGQDTQQDAVFAVDDNIDVDFNQMVQRNAVLKEVRRIRCMMQVAGDPDQLSLQDVVQALHSSLQQQHLANDKTQRIQSLLETQQDLHRFQHDEHQRHLLLKDITIAELTETLGKTKEDLERTLRSAADLKVGKEGVEAAMRSLEPKPLRQSRMWHANTFLQSACLEAEEQAWHLRKIVRQFGGSGDHPIAMAEAFRQRSAASKQAHAVENLSQVLIDLVGELPSQLPNMTSAVPTQLSLDYNLLSHMFLSSWRQHRKTMGSEVWCEHAEIEVVSITPVDIPTDMYDRYRNRCDRLASHTAFEPAFGNVPVWRPSGLNAAQECFMFHGTTWQNVSTICSSGFDMNKAGTASGAAFGRAIYFAPHASKSDQYCDKDARSRKCIIMARIALGRCMPRWTYCPGFTQPHDDFDSISAVPKKYDGCVDHLEVAIFQKEACLPLFKFIYKHKATCRCYTCSRDG